MIQNSKQNNYRKFKNITTLDYFILLIEDKPRSSGTEDLGLAPFDTIVSSGNLQSLKALFGLISIGNKACFFVKASFQQVS